MNQLKEDDKFWNDLIYKVCKGDVANMRNIKKMDIFEFFNYIENIRADAGSRTNNKGKQKRSR